MKRIILFLLAVLLLWPSHPTAATPLGRWVARHFSAHGDHRIKKLEAQFYASQDTDDVDYQLRCLDSLIAESRRQKASVVEVNALAERASLFYNYDMNDSVLIAVRRDMERVKDLGQWQVYYEMWGLVANTYVFMGQNNMGIRETKAMFDDAKQRGDGWAWVRPIVSWELLIAICATLTKVSRCLRNPWPSCPS